MWCLCHRSRGKTFSLHFCILQAIREGLEMRLVRRLMDHSLLLATLYLCYFYFQWESDKWRWLPRLLGDSVWVSSSRLLVHSWAVLTIWNHSEAHGGWAVSSLAPTSTLLGEWIVSCMSLVGMFKLLYKSSNQELQMGMIQAIESFRWEWSKQSRASDGNHPSNQACDACAVDHMIRFTRAS